MESEHGSKPMQGLNHPSSTIDKGELSFPDKRLGSSSSSSSTISSVSDSSSEDPFQKIPHAPSKSTRGITNGDGIPELNPMSRLDSNYGEKDMPGNSSPQFELSDDSLPESTLPSALLGNSPDSSPQNRPAIQSPPVQMMEHPGDSSPYRIPSSVFARTKSTNPVEWSVASNESLFSIHMGNMSFSRDHILLMGRSGELGIFKSGELVKPGDLKSGELLKHRNLKSGELLKLGDLKSGELLKPGEATTSIQFMNYTNSQLPVYQTTDIGRRNANLSQGVGATEAAAFETMKEVLRENEADRSEAKSAVAKGTSHSTHHSDENGSSVKSFAFPILTGDGDKGSSVKNGSGKPHRHQEQHLPPQPQTPAAKPDAAGAQPTASWFSCFSCCPFRS